MLRNYELPSSPPAPRLGVADGATSWDIPSMLLATSAAPTFFPPVTRNDEVYVDGCLLANNKTPAFVAEARALWPNRPIGLIVSMGCGFDGAPAGHEAASQMSLAYWIKHVLAITIDTGRRVDREMVNWCAKLLHHSQIRPAHCQHEA